MTARIDPIQAYCKTCLTYARIQRFTTFSYWYCDKCKDEVEVNLKVVHTPKGELFTYAPVKENEIHLTKYGVYLIEYIDGSYEYYYNASAKYGKHTRLDGSIIRATTRLTEPDLPSRKPVQSVPTPGEGTESSRLCVRNVSDAPNSVYGSASNRIKRWTDIQPTIGSDINVAQDSSQDDFNVWSGTSSGAQLGVPSSFEEALQDLGYDSKCVQHGQVPPPDEL